MPGGKRSHPGNKDRPFLGPGDAAHIPPSAEHEERTVDGEAEILSCKDVVTG